MVHVGVKLVSQWSHSCNNTTQNNTDTRWFHERAEGVGEKLPCLDLLPPLVDRCHCMRL